MSQDALQCCPALSVDLTNTPLAVVGKVTKHVLGITDQVAEASLQIHLHKIHIRKH